MKKQNKTFPYDVSSLERMISDIQARNRGSVGRIAESSFFRIPAVKSFNILSSEENDLLKGTGLDRKLPAKKEVILQEGNNRLNQYMELKIVKMRELLNEGKPEEYWKLVDHEMKRSIAFRVSAFNRVHRGWYRDMPLERVYQITYGMNKIIEKSLSDLKYFRVEIPKDGPKALLQWYLDNPGGKYSKTRPLGVPTAPWRVILHLWNGFLVLFVEEELKRFNHAYTPGVGTMTCLREWVNKVLPAKYVYEFDIKGFFNNVSIGKVMKMLIDRGLPWDQAETLYGILKSIPENLEPKDASSALGIERISALNFIQDFFARERVDVNGFPVQSEDFWERYDTAYEQTYDGYLADRTALEQLHSDPKYTLREIVHRLSFRGMDRGLNLRGLPQGAAPSTTLSLLVLSPWHRQLLKQGVSLLMYADDGFLYSDKPFEPFPPDGLEFAEEKCFWVKKNGEYVKDQVKFLGVVWDWTSKLLSAKTRELSRLMFDNRQLEVIDSYLSMDSTALAQQSREESRLNVMLDPETVCDKQSITKLDFFLKNAGFDEDIDQSPNSTSKSFQNYLKAARDTAAELGNDRMLKLVNSGIWGQALSKLYGGTWSRLFFPEKAQYNKGSWWDLFYNLEQLSRDRRLQRLASTWACEWLIEHMTAMSGSVKKARKHATWSLRYFKPRKSDKLMFRDLRNALMMEYYWNEKNLSLVPLELDGCHSFNSNLPEPEWLSPDEFEADSKSQHQPEKPIRMTPEERRVLRYNLMSRTQRLLYRPNQDRIMDVENGIVPFEENPKHYEIAAKAAVRSAKEMLKPYVTISLKDKLNKAESLRLHKLVWETVYK